MYMPVTANVGPPGRQDQVFRDHPATTTDDRCQPYDPPLKCPPYPPGTDIVPQVPYPLKQIEYSSSNRGT